MAATRRMAAASATEVPPNLRTRMGAVVEELVMDRFAASEG
jgi:hypothetical protein